MQVQSLDLGIQVPIWIGFGSGSLDTKFFEYILIGIFDCGERLRMAVLYFLARVIRERPKRGYFIEHFIAHRVVLVF